jgi:uncharacterized protein YjbJ (UPF0337 family)
VTAEAFIAGLMALQERYGISDDAVRKDVDDWRNTQ